MERYQVTTNKDSGIVNDPNKWEIPQSFLPTKFLHVKRDGQRRNLRLAPPVPATEFLPAPMRETSAQPREVFVSPSESRTTIQVNRELHLKSTVNLTSSQVATSLQVKLELHFNRRSDFTSSERQRPLWRYVLGALRGICLEVIVGGSRFFVDGLAEASLFAYFGLNIG